MAAKYGRPVDTEWVWDGERVTYVQLRPITSIGSVSYYSNRFSREVLPGVILPLVWSVNIPIVNGAWIRLLEQLVGPTGLAPNDLAARIYSRAYFNMGALGGVFDTLGVPRESLEILSGIEGADGHMPRPRINAKTLRQLPRVTAFAARTLTYERERRLWPRWSSLRRAARLARARDGSAGRNPRRARPAASDRRADRVPQRADAAPLRGVQPRACSRLKRRDVAYDSVDFANRDPATRAATRPRRSTLRRARNALPTSAARDRRRGGVRARTTAGASLQLARPLRRAIRPLLGLRQRLLARPVARGSRRRRAYDLGVR